LRSVPDGVSVVWFVRPLPEVEKLVLELDKRSSDSPDKDSFKDKDSFTDEVSFNLLADDDSFTLPALRTLSSECALSPDSLKTMLTLPMSTNVGSVFME
jgi:hypothetical protein